MDVAPLRAYTWALLLGLFVPVAWFLGLATEELGKQAGPGVGGLLNATFGNATELIIAIFALSRGLTEVVKASLTGSIVGNLLLVLGLSMLAGGVKYKVQHFSREASGIQITMLVVAVIGLVMPALYVLSTGIRSGVTLEEMSLGIAGILLLAYVFGLFFSLRTHRDIFNPVSEVVEKPRWEKRFALSVLVVSTVLVAIESEILVGSLETARQSLGLTELFVGVIIVVVSLFTDISSEMILPILPFFLIQVLGANALIVGIEEGFSDSVVSFMKILSGRFSDIAGKRKRFVGAGYALSTVMKTLFPFARSWPEFIAIASLFSFADFSYAFLLLRAGQSNGTVIVILLYVLYNIVYAVHAFPAGILSDRVGRKPVVLVGYVAFIAMTTLLVFSDALAVLVVAFILYGLEYGMAEGTQRALVADFAPSDIKATVLGAYHTSVGTVKLASGLVAGFLWVAVAPTATFAFGAVTATFAAVALSLWSPGAKS